jgi:anti-sigma factor RsiW
MKDREFIRLLNLYVDREITADDALRLESEVASNPERRKVYDQYCRIQKACGVLAEEYRESASNEGERVIDFPSAQRTFRPAYAGLAAAAAVAVAVVGLRFRADLAPDGAPVAVTAPARATPVAGPGADSMKAVFTARVAPDAGRDATLLATNDASVRADGLDWIGDIHLSPVLPASQSGLLQEPRTDLRAPAIAEPASDKDSQEPAEMAAFRFQR